MTWTSRHTNEGNEPDGNMANVRLSGLRLYPWTRRRTVWCKFTDISEERSTYIFSVETRASRLLDLHSVLKVEVVLPTETSVICQTTRRDIPASRIERCCIDEQLAEIPYSLFSLPHFTTSRLRRCQLAVFTSN
jgi:hypothetical protein